MSTPPPKLAPHRAVLAALSARTNTPLPSLIAAFAILHEATALVPLVSVFFGARALGVGERAVAAVRGEVGADEGEGRGWLRERGARWIGEGEGWAQRVGKRYGIFGFSKRAEGDDAHAQGAAGEEDDEPAPSRHLAGDVANAVLAYGVTKALLPARIGLSLYLAPAFSRRFVEPVWSRLVGRWK